MWERRTVVVTTRDTDCEVEYVDTGGDGPVVVLLHGALMDEQHWAPVVERLEPDLRCVVPILPLGGHRIPMPDAADMAPAAVADLVVALLDKSAWTKSRWRATTPAARSRSWSSPPVPTGCSG